MKKYLITSQFVIGDKENIIEVVDKWLKETVSQYDSPSEQFDITEQRTVRRATDVIPKRVK